MCYLQYDGTFADHLEMTIQLGYVILFSSAFPLAAICAMLNNLIEIRSDAFKLAYVCQRPFGQRVPNIGTWQVRNFADINPPLFYDIHINKLCFLI